MTANLGIWEIRTNPAKQEGGDRVPEYRVTQLSASVPCIDPDLEETAGDFITRHVLEKDSVFFEG